MLDLLIGQFLLMFFPFLQDFVELPPDDMQRLLVHNTVSIINIKIARWLNEVSVPSSPRQ